MFFLAVAAALLASAACGNGGDAPKPTGNELSDEQYLAAICSGTSKFSDALISKTKPEEIGAVIKQFAADMKKLDPPGDLKSYNEQFVKYLENAVADPTSLVTQNPPLPAKEARARLAAKETSVPECKDGTFFSRGAGATPSP
ncbi:MAG: hypothetical protein C0506_01890 [Anaerolinea sp.]|nr:hypothetical protein [Anaerolinea sp.]